MALPLPIETQRKVEETIRKTKGRFFRVVFIKRTNGEERTMDCRINVKKFAKGGSLAFSPKEKNLVPVWDLRAYDPETDETGYRFIPLESVKMIKCGDVTIFE